MFKYILIGALCATTVVAGPTISSAFGKKLGDTVSKSDKGKYIAFTPRKKFRGFNKYLVQTTPKTRRIHTIAARQVFDSRADAEAEYKLVLAMLLRKYRVKGEDVIYKNALDKTARFMIGVRFIMVTTATDFPKTVVMIVYSDLKGIAAAEKERIAIEVSKTDTSGL